VGLWVKEKVRESLKIHQPKPGEKIAQTGYNFRLIRKIMGGRERGETGRGIGNRGTENDYA